MSKLHTFIWGVRDGFKAKTALYPDKSRLSDPNELQIYNAIVPYFTEDFDLPFRACDRSFFFILQAANYYLYSFVDTKHVDYTGDRRAYLVYSIAVPQGWQVEGDLNGVLHELKEFYQKKQGEYTVIQNRFTASQIEEITGKLSLSPRRNTTSPKNNIFLSYGNEALPQLGTFHGNNVYFIPENSNQSLVDALGFRIESLSAVSRTNEINRRFAEILSNRKEADIPEAKSLIAAGSALIEPHLQAEFNTWLRAIEENKERHQTLNDFHAELSKLKSNPSVSISRAKHLYEQHLYIANYITPEDNRCIKELLEKHREIEKNDKIQLIKQLIDNAEKSGWKIDPRELDQHEPYRTFLSDDLEQKIKVWKTNFSNSKVESLWIKFQRLHGQIKKDTNSELKKDLDKLKEKVNNLHISVNTLEAHLSKKFLDDDKYQYLTSYKWVPRERRMAPIILFSAIALVLSAAGYYFLTLDTERPITSNHSKDSDGDGVIDSRDMDRISNWIVEQKEKEYSRAYPKVKWSLKDNVDSLGRIDLSKTKHLCDCLKDSIVKPPELNCPIDIPIVPGGQSQNQAQLRKYIKDLNDGKKVDMTKILELISYELKVQLEKNSKLKSAMISYDNSKKVYKYNDNNVQAEETKKLLKSIFGLNGSGVSGAGSGAGVTPLSGGDGGGKTPPVGDDANPNDDKTIMGFKLQSGEPNIEEAVKKDKIFFQNLKPKTAEAQKLKLIILRKLLKLEKEK